MKFLFGKTFLQGTSITEMHNSGGNHDSNKNVLYLFINVDTRWICTLSVKQIHKNTFFINFFFFDDINIMSTEMGIKGDIDLQYPKALLSYAYFV